MKESPEEKRRRRSDALRFELHGHFVIFCEHVIIGWQFAITETQAVEKSKKDDRLYVALPFRLCRHEQIIEAERLGRCDLPSPGASSPLRPV